MRGQGANLRAIDNKTAGSAKAVYAGLIVLLLLWLGYGLFHAVTLWISPERAWVTTKLDTRATDTKTMRTENRANIGFDLTQDPFYRNAPPQDVSALGADAPETRLNLKLLGRRASADGTAILLTPDRREAVYRVGEEIMSGVTLQSVTDGYIVISQNGQLERLAFTQNERTALAERGALDSDGNTLDALLSAVSLRRVSEGGKLLGYALNASNDTVVLSDFGFQEGDVITAIGGQSLTTARPDMAGLAKALEGQRLVSIDIIRGGQTLTLRVGQ